MTRQPQVEVKDVTLEYRPSHGRSVLALDRVSLDVADGEFVSLLGPSGCGKSTLLYLLGGFIRPVAGTITVAGKKVIDPGPDRGIVFQHFALFPWKTALANVEYGLKLKGMAANEARARAQEFLELVGLAGFEQSYPSQLSGGMRQRAAIARTLALDPNILLMDEPFGALDAQTRGVLQEELLSIWQRTKKTIIFVTHDVQEAVLLSDKIALMSARPGRIVSVMDNLFDKSDPNRHREPQFIRRVDEIWDYLKSDSVGH